MTTIIKAIPAYRGSEKTSSHLSVRSQSRNILRFLTLVLFLLANTNLLIAQPTGLEIKMFNVGNLHSWYSSLGCELESRGPLGDQMEGMNWPAQYGRYDNQAAKSMWIGTTDYVDPTYNDTPFPYKVVVAGTRTSDPLRMIMPVEFKMIGKFDHPLVIVDGNPATDMDFDDRVDEIDPTMAADRVIVNKLNSSLGITITRTLSAYSQENNDNFFIYDYVFENTGIVDLDGTVVEQTLTDVVFHFQYRYAFGWVAFEENWYPSNNITWGRNSVNHTIWEDPDNGDPMRATYVWYGPHSQSIHGCDADWGLPHPSEGRALGHPAYTGVVVLHADTDASDETDDFSQPSTTTHLGSDGDNLSFDQYVGSIMATYYENMTQGHPEKTIWEEMQSSGIICGDQYGGDPGGYSPAQGYGPYNLEPGENVHIVFAEAVAGIDFEKSTLVGNTWFNDLGPFDLPGSGTTNDRNEYKREWVQTGEDSLMQTFRRAISAYDNNYEIDQPPPPPSEFQVNSGGDRIILTWNQKAEEDNNFSGYRVFRAEGRPDAFFQKIFECGPGTDVTSIANQFEDVTARRGFDYYYYVESVGSNNLVSSKFYTMTNTPAYLRRPASEFFENLRIVPNPFHVKSRSMQFNSPDRLAFYGLPGFCTIRIYTERGDLVETIDHQDGSGDELWSSITEARQIIVSGLYIAHIEVTRNITDEETGEVFYRKGEQTYRKFVVIR